jgi:DNA polymerase III subunit delta'
MHIIGHEKERKKLSEIVGNGCVAQSYLFSGPQEIGKSLCALEFAMSLVGERGFVPTDVRPYPFDVMVVRPAEETKRGVTKTKRIPAEAVREALAFLAEFPVVGAYRVVIIEDAHMLSMAAQNVLLKTLEEPNPSSVIVLLTHEPGSIIDTILSRVERMRFGFVPEEEMLSGFSASEFSSRIGNGNIAPFFFSLGRPGMIIRALSDTKGFAADQERLAKLFRLSTLSLTEKLRFAEELSADVPHTIRLLEWWLPGLHVRISGLDNRQAQRFFGLLEETERTLSLLKTTQANARLLLEQLFLFV